MKLHLGCGQRYLKGYVNIDLPSAEHSVQKKSVADIHQDIRTLSYEEESIEEIRLHHLFEHFTRPIACALIVTWRSWLEPKGILRIEVPDLEKTAKVMLRPFTSFKKKALAERHIFGSHEASWAVHCIGYSAKTLCHLLRTYELDIIEVNRNTWRGTYNIEVIAEKNGIELTNYQCFQITRKFLSNFLVDQTEGELSLLEVWLQIYKKRVEPCFVKKNQTK